MTYRPKKATVSAEGWEYKLPPMPLRQAFAVAYKLVRGSRNGPGLPSVTVKIHNKEQK